MPFSARAHLLVSVLSTHRKRAHSPSSKDEHSIGLKDSLLAHSSDPVEMRRLNYQTPGKEQQTPLHPTSSGPHHQVPMPEEELQSSPPAALHLPSHSGTEGAQTEDVQVSALWSTNPSPWLCHCRHTRLENLDKGQWCVSGIM